MLRAGQDLGIRFGADPQRRLVAYLFEKGKRYDDRHRDRGIWIAPLWDPLRRCRLRSTSLRRSGTSCRSASHSRASGTSLPCSTGSWRRRGASRAPRRVRSSCARMTSCTSRASRTTALRSEEGRVGKEGRSRGSAYPLKKKKDRVEVAGDR